MGKYRKPQTADYEDIIRLSGLGCVQNSKKNIAVSGKNGSEDGTSVCKRFWLF